jgi:hypothetical protein
MSSLTSSRPSPAATLPEWLSRREGWLWALVVVALVADVALTAHGVANGYEEMNPLARAALSAHGVPGLGGLKLLALGVGVVGRSALPSRYAAVVPLGLALPWTFAACSNALLIVG